MMFEGDTFIHGGRQFRVQTPYDDIGETPWERNDGTGIVSEWTRRDKKPGERVLSTDHGMNRYYDFARTMEKARKEGWGLRDQDKAALALKLGREPTKGDIIAEAVERDFAWLRRWCKDEWSYIGVVVEHMESGRSESLWGIESDSDGYIEEIARNLADEINGRLNAALAAEIAEGRPDLAPSY